MSASDRGAADLGVLSDTIRTAHPDVGRKLVCRLPPHNLTISDPVNGEERLALRRSWAPKTAGD